MEYLDSKGGIIHLTGEGGKLMPVFLTDAENHRSVSVELIALSVQQITRTQDCVVDEDIITISRRQFDAKLARTLGIPSGPLFGKLSKGETVTLPDGRTVTPDEVTKVTQTSIRIPGLEN
jgi:ribonuclease BN (tRNA processing enzyme)